MQSVTLPKVVLWLIIGVFFFLALFVLAGAGGESNVGRYQMAVLERSNFTDIFVIDTATGVVKYVGKDEGKPFDQIKGK
ncbi:MAG: hypothetical protein M0036_11505 [Desulfobacteraceae bacterium]|nr:hypothetical protein [Desulfobacteraceae bacterium]